MFVRLTGCKKGEYLFVVHLALGGCLKAPPVRYGITADTGGHIAYVLEAAQAQAMRDDVRGVAIVTRLFADDRLDPIHACPAETISDKLTIARIATADRAYLEKDALAAEVSALAETFCTYLAALAVKPDVIHAHFADAAAIAIVARTHFGIPVVYTPHALGIDKHKLGFAGETMDRRIKQETAAIGLADAIIVSSRDEANRQVAAYNTATLGQVHLLRPGVPHFERDASSATFTHRLIRSFAHPERPIVLAVARPVRKKNLSAILQAFAGDPQLQEMANLVILAGQHDHASGEEREVLDDLHMLAAQPALRGKVALPASHDGSDLAAVYDMAAEGGVFVNPALHEPFGLTLIEAAAAGVPVVATCNGGPVEILATLGNGLVIDPLDSAGIAAACRALLGDPAAHRRHAEAGRQGVAQYSWTAYAEASTRIYRSCSVPQLLACDIDNTLTGCRDGVIAFRDWARTRDLPFVVATGRCFDDARQILDDWNLPEPDAYIVDVGSCIMRKGPDGTWQACPRFAAQLDAGWDRPAIARTLRPLRLQLQPTGVQTGHKLSFFGSTAEAAMIRTVLLDAGHQARVIHSHETLIDVLPVQGGKAAAIATYAAGLNLPLSACIAAGDSGNDVDMLTQCGFAIIVGNADSDLADLPMRPGMIRVRQHHAAGVLEGLEALAMIAPAMPVAA